MTMAVRKALDQRPGPVPEIRANGDSVTFRLDIAGVDRDTRLIIRCDPDGTVQASIEHGSPREATDRYALD
jgi:hypothetical protein